MRPSGPARRCAGAALVVALAVSLAACGSDSLRARSARTARTGQVVDASSTAALRGATSHLMLPSGRLDLTLTAPRHQAAAEDVRGAAPLRAPRHAALVGVSWVLQRAAYPDSPNRQLTEPSDIFGAPRPVHLWLVADGRRHEIPGVDNLTTTGDRPSNTVWLTVPEGVRRWQFRVDYDGLTQTADARTRKVDAGRAAPLYRALPLGTSGNCDLGADALSGCGLHYAIGYPYVTGGGWAPAGKTWVLLNVSFTEGYETARTVTVGGSRPGPDIGDKAEPFTAFLVSAGSAAYAVRGYGRADTLQHGGVVRRRLTATLYRSAS